MKRSKAARAALEDMYVAIARRDGGWKCAYCGDPLAPINDHRAFIRHPARFYGPPCPNGDHDDMPDDQQCWHEGYLTAVPGYEFPVSDHVIPKSRGGSDHIDNRVLACNWCNCSKGARLLSELQPNWWERKWRQRNWVAGEVLPA